VGKTSAITEIPILNSINHGNHIKANNTMNVVMMVAKETIEAKITIVMNSRAL
jgi:hypothetical protein